MSSKYFLFLIFAMAVSTNVAWADIPNKIIGHNDLIVVNADASNIPFKYKELVNAIGLLKSGCTVTHIGYGYAITAGHCFWAPPEGKSHLPCEDETITWGLRDGAEPYLVSKCEEIIIAQQHADDYDFAIIKVSPVPPVAISVDLDRHPVIGDPLTVFSHPDFQPLQWSGLCKVEENLHPDFSKMALQHQCDTVKGSSGAALISDLNLKIVGVHVGGADPEPDRTDPAPLPIFQTGANYGTYILGTPFETALRELGFK